MLEFLEKVLLTIAEYGIVILELIGVLIILATVVRCLICAIKHNGIVPLMLGKNIALALEFMLGGEVLRTVVSKDVKTLAMVGLTMVLRAAMTVLIHWESSNEKKEESEAAQKAEAVKEAKETC
ncbi:MAG: DUF1622 domain-containing protein [Candidatus Limiplasma sp.]|nr:DUF1622 domain-containing protein [Clostridiales bacterium]MDY3817222.1 DUF1622 domain-containing protein [Candidatus Limiplasma sp.]